MRKIVSDFFRPYTIQQVAAFRTMALEIERYGLSVMDVIEATTEYFQAMEAASEQRGGDTVSTITTKTKSRPTAICPDCGAGVTITPVNISKCTNVGGDWRTSLQCSSPACRFTELSVKNLKEWL